MRGLFLRWLIQTLAILAAAYLLEGIVVRGFLPALFAAAVLAVLNALLRPVLLLLTLPLNILTLGLFTFVINALLLQMASGVIGGFEVHGFGTAFIGSLLISLVSWLLTTLIGDKGKVDVIVLNDRGQGRWE